MSRVACAKRIPPKEHNAGHPVGGAWAKMTFATYLIDQGIVTKEQISVLPAEAWRPEDSLGRIALFHGLLDDIRVLRILTQQENTRDPFGQIAVQQGHLTETQLKTLVAGQCVRACIEFAEDLILAGHLTLRTGLKAVIGFLGEERSLEGICAEAIPLKRA